MTKQQRLESCLHLERTKSFTRPITRRLALRSSVILFAGLVVAAYKSTQPEPTGDYRAKPDCSSRNNVSRFGQPG